MGYYDQPPWSAPSPYIPPNQPTPPKHVFSEKYPDLNPILASDTTLLKFDVSRRPCVDIHTTTYHANCLTSATATPVTHMRLISKAFPWSIDVKSTSYVSCEAIWDALHNALQEPIVDSEWGMIVGNKDLKESVEKAAKKREKERDKRYKRIDWLGQATMFKGLDKDEEFEKQRLLPGSEPCPDTWVVQFGKQ